MHFPRFGIVAAALVFGLSVSAFADNVAVPYVDVSTAQALVDTLVKENDTLNADNDRINKDVSGLIDQIVANKKWIAEIGPILDDLKARGASLATLSEQLQDRTLKAKLVAYVDKNHASDKAMTKRLNDLLAKVDDLNKQADTKRNQVAVNTAKVFRNNESIILLQAALAKTKTQETSVNTLAALVDAASAKADSFLAQSQATPAATTTTTKP